jgi:translation elongation factor EF-Tu-like GTPase
MARELESKVQATLINEMDQVRDQENRMLVALQIREIFQMLDAPMQSTKRQERHQLHQDG